MRKTLSEILERMRDLEQEDASDNTSSYVDILEQIREDVHRIFPDIRPEDEFKAFKILLEEYWFTH